MYLKSAYNRRFNIIFEKRKKLGSVLLICFDMSDYLPKFTPYLVYTAR